MEITLNCIESPVGSWTLIIGGTLDQESMGQLKNAADMALQSRDIKTICLDLSGVNFMDSSGLGALVTISQEAKAKNARFTLKNLSPRAARLLEVTGLNHIWPIQQDPA